MAENRQRAPRSDSKLLQACIDGNLAVVRQRIAAKANINAGRKDKKPPLELAAGCGHLEVVRELIAAGADVNQIHKVNYEAFPTSPLMSAIAQYQLPIVNELVQAGASAAIETHPGWNAASKAVSKTTEYWWLQESPETPFSDLKSLAEIDRPPQTFDEWFNFLKRAIASGAKINDYCLWDACKSGCTPVVHCLISIGADVNYIGENTTPLQIAIMGEFDEIALALINAKANPNLAGKWLNQPTSPPLKLALAKERHRVIRALLNAGAKAD